MGDDQRSVLSAQCPVPSAQYAVPSAQCSVLSAQCSVPSAQCTVLSAGKSRGGFRETESDEWIPPCAPSLTHALHIPLLYFSVKIQMTIQRSSPCAPSLTPALPPSNNLTLSSHQILLTPLLPCNMTYPTVRIDFTSTLQSRVSRI